MKTWLHVYPAALYGKDKEDELSFKKLNGVLLLTFDNIQDLDGIVGVKQKAAMLPSTFSVIEGVDGKTVHVLAKYTDMEGNLPENEEEAEQLYRIAYQEIAPLYQAIIKVKQMCKSGFCQSLILTVIKVIAYRKSSILLKRMIRNMAIGICIGDSFFD